MTLSECHHLAQDLSQDDCDTQEVPVTNQVGSWASPMASGFSGPSGRLCLAGPAAPIYNPPRLTVHLSVPPSPPRLRGIFSRLPWEIVKHLSLGPLLEELCWKFLGQGNFSAKLCTCLSPLLLSFVLPPGILPSLCHPRLSHLYW